MISGMSFDFCTVMLSDQHWLGRLGSSASAFVMSLGGLGIMLLAIADSSFLSVPEANDALIILLSAGGTWSRMAYFVGMTILGSVIGCMLLYSLGRKGGSPILRRRFSPRNVERAEKLYTKYGMLTVFIPSILPPPTPFKIFVLSAGVFRLNPLAFFTAVTLGRTIRYSMWGILAVLYGDAVKRFVEHNIETIGWVLFGVVLLALAGALVYYLFKKRAGKSGDLE